MQAYDVIIIGAGPAGLFTAINCAVKERKVLILEKNDRAGKKLLLSGAGQCNITHAGDIREFLNYYGDNYRFLKKSLLSFTNGDLLNFFKERGLDFITQENGKIFPNTLRAKDVLDILLKECENKGVEIKYNSIVEGVDYISKEKEFNIMVKGDKMYKSKYLVISTGGMSYTNTGSTGDGYTFAEKLGHSIISPLPALTPLYIKDYRFKDLSGVSFDNVPISLWRGGKKIKETIGDILFTHKNISGPGILNFSRYVLPGDIIKINFVKTDNIEEFRREFIERINIEGKKLVKTILKDYSLPKRFIDKILELVGIDEKVTGANLRKKKRNKLIEMLTAYPMTIERLGDFHIAMVTRGGVNLKEVNSKTMESKIIDGLYFTGEVLDIDGDTGGYNIQAAFSTAYMAGQSIKNRLV